MPYVRLKKLPVKKVSCRSRSLNYTAVKWCCKVKQYLRSFHFRRCECVLRRSCRITLIRIHATHKASERFLSALKHRIIHPLTQVHFGGVNTDTPPISPTVSPFPALHAHTAPCQLFILCNYFLLHIHWKWCLITSTATYNHSRVHVRKTQNCSFSLPSPRNLRTATFQVSLRMRFPSSALCIQLIFIRTLILVVRTRFPNALLAPTSSCLATIEEKKSENVPVANLVSGW